MVPARSEYAPLISVLLSPPEHFDLYPNNEIAKTHVREGRRADRRAALKEHEGFARALASAGVEVLMAAACPGLPYQVFTRDIGHSLGDRIFLGNFTHDVRREEIDVAAAVLENRGIEMARLDPGGPARLEGGDVVFLDETTAAVGLGERTNRAGLAAFAEEVSSKGVSVIPVPFESRFLHLDMILSVPGDGLAVACLAALPDPFKADLTRRGFDVFDVPVEGVFDMPCNLLGLGHGRVCSPASNRRVNAFLQSRNFTVVELPLEAVMMGGGGPRCLSFPVLRGTTPPHS